MLRSRIQVNRAVLNDVDGRSLKNSRHLYTFSTTTTFVGHTTRSEHHASTPTVLAMPREVEPSNNAKAFVLEALRENLRIDGRALDAFRPIDLAFGSEYGLATVRMGKTSAVVKISADVVKPFEDRKFDGIFTISTELSPIASPAFEVGRCVV